MSICNTKRGESTLHSAYNGTRVITVTVRAYRSDADVTLILPAGKPNLGCQDSTTDDVRRNYKSSKWKHNKTIFLTSKSITKITLRFHLNDGIINLNDCRTSASTSHGKTDHPRAALLSQGLVGTQAGEAGLPQKGSGPAALVPRLAWTWQGGLVNQLQRNRSAVLHSPPLGQSLQMAGCP